MRRGLYVEKNEGGAVAVGNLERYITDTALAMGWRPTTGEVTPRRGARGYYRRRPGGTGLRGYSRARRGTG